MSNFEKLDHDSGILAHDDYFGSYMAQEQILDYQQATQEERITIDHGHHSHVDYLYGRYGRFSERPLATANPLQNNRLR